MKTAFIAVAALLGTAAVANANTVTMRYVSKGEGRDIKIITGSTSQNVFAGQLKHSISNGTGLGTLFNGDFFTYCADIHQTAQTSNATFQVVGVHELALNAPMGLDKAWAINRMYTFANGAEMDTTSNDDFAAAFQIAIWEVITDFAPAVGAASLNVTSGGFVARQTNNNALWSSVSGHVASLLNAAVNGQQGATLLGLGNSGRQDQIVHVPGPGAAALAGLGLLLSIKRRRTAK